MTLPITSKVGYSLFLIEVFVIDDHKDTRKKP